MNLEIDPSFAGNRQVLVLKTLGVLTICFGVFYFLSAVGPGQLFGLMFLIEGVGIFFRRAFAVGLSVLVFGLPVLIFVVLLMDKITELDFPGSLFALGLLMAFLVPLSCVCYLWRAFR